MHFLRCVNKLSSKIVTLNYLFLACLLFATSCDENEESAFDLAGQKATDTQNILTWSPLQGNDGYKVWRTNDDINQTTPDLVATVNEAEYWDQELPLSTSLSYYVTTTVNGTERRTNTINVAGRSTLNILPYQARMIPEKELALIRDYSSIILLDFRKKVVVKKVDFNGRIGQFDINSHNGTLEVYIPCSDNKLYIMKAEDLTQIGTIDTDKPAFAVVVNNAGKIFCTTSDYSSALQVFDRESLAHVTNIPAETDCGLGLLDDNHLMTISTHISPGIMTFYSLNDDGSMMSDTDDPYHYDYEMDGNRLKISDKYIVTSTQGFVYTADQEMKHITKLSSSSNLTDFEFSTDGATIYAAQTDQRSILKATIANNAATISSIPTVGYPWILARSGNKLLVLSSPSPFTPYFMTSSITIETITLP